MVSASEVAYFSLTPNDLESLEKENMRSSAKVLGLKQNPRTLLATILISNNFINIAIVILSDVFLRSVVSPETFDSWAEKLSQNAVLSWMSLETLSHMLSFLITVVIVTFVLVLFGEVAPKIYANINNIRHAKLMSTPLSFLTKLFYPLNSLLVGWSSNLEERIYTRRLSSHHTTDRRQLDKAIELAVPQDELREEVDILKGIIKFGDVTTKQIMKSRVDVVGLDLSDSFDKVLDIIKESGSSRLPVYEEDFDNIKGILYAKDLLGFTHEGRDFQWIKLVRNSVLYVPESKKIDVLLKEFQKKRTHIAIVVDEYGGSSGIVTLEDVMEEVVGDIRDEFDHDDHIDYVKINDTNFIFEGKTLLNDVVRITGLDSEIFDDSRGSADSLAGLILELKGIIPKQEEVIPFKNIKFRIVSVSKRRIEKVNIKL